MAQPPELKIIDVDLPHVSETFADSITKIGFDGQAWRLEFCVTRMDEPKPPIMPGKRYPACRLVLTINAGLELFNKLKGIIDIMEKQGAIKNIPAPNVVVPAGGSKPN